MVDTPMPVPPHSPHRQYDRLFQIDFLKAWMILLVIMDHSFTHAFLRPYLAVFWERISIPIFMVVFGINTVISYEKLPEHEKTLKYLYSFKYFQKKIERFVLPYLLLYLLLSLIQIIVNIGDIATISNFPYDTDTNMFMGFPPMYGPGLWFIPVILGSIFILPLMYYSFRYSPILTLIGSFMIEIAIHVIIYFVYRDTIIRVVEWDYLWTGFWYTEFFFRYSLLSLLSGVALGMWIIPDYRFQALKNWVIYILGSLSFLYLIVYFILGGSYNVPGFSWVSGDYHFLTFPWAALIVLIILNVIPQSAEGSIPRFIKTVSRATYHILLSQIFYFAIWYNFFIPMYNPLLTPNVWDGQPLNYLWYFPLNILITFSLGIFWKKFEDRYYNTLKQKSSLQNIHRVFVIVGAIALVAWIVAQIAFFILYPIPDTIINI